MNVRFTLPGAILGLFLLLIVSCQDEEQTGRIVVKITDEPFPITMIDEATVTITKVEIRTASAEEEAEEESSFIVLFEGSHEATLTDLRNGVTDELANLEIPAEGYDLIRIHVSDASITLLKSGDAPDDEPVPVNIPVNVPSGDQTGVKVFIKPGIKLGGGETVEVLLDFNLSGSFVPLGSWDDPENIERFNFIPVIRAVNNSQTGMIKGFIFSDTEPLDDVLVFVQEGDQQLPTLTESDGSYAILGIPAGSYEITAEKEGYSSSTCAAVEVLAGKVTEKDFVLGKIPEFPE